MNSRIVVIGDSNTYGYDSYGGRYTKPWPSLIQKNVLNLGMCGMMFSDLNNAFLSKLKKEDCIFIQLGSNDILNRLPTDYIEKKLNQCIHSLQKYHVIYLIPRDIEGYPSIVPLFMNKDIHYINLNEFCIEMCWDGIHFSKKGHQQLAQILKKSTYLE